MIKRLIRAIFVLFLVISVFFILIVGYIKFTTISQVRNDMDDIKDSSYGVALILGAGIKNNKPSMILKDRLDAGIELYKNKKIHTFLLSGDGIEKYYNEVKVMENYLVDSGIDPSCIILDPNGTNTSKSITNTKEVFNINKCIIVSQSFHVNRALYLANKEGIDAIAFPAADRKYKDLTYLYIRDALASVKDFFVRNFMS